ncbi:unnamed protein product [Clonostachys byssicola]|uniref:Uncharacterized protein n=1 Tax=Clonostachys byssicola TaxID=160290 RepID=A0A9N9UA02_9HYPO|nr:unnamed protein product [Clonostachys byssicola]
MFCSISIIWAAESLIPYPSDDGTRDNGYYSIPVPETFKLPLLESYPNGNSSSIERVIIVIPGKVLPR